MNRETPSPPAAAARSPLAPLLQPVQAFLAAESAGGIVLLVFAVAALSWANSPWGDTYQHFWHAKLSVDFAGHAFAMSLEHWVNDGLMVIFFLLVGLEIKRELLMGELASIRRATLPIAAAVGGMLVPAAIYAAFNAGGAGAAGWGIPMATDIAFAVGIVALLGTRVPSSVKVLLLTLAIVDDIGAIAVIAIFYSDGLRPGLLVAAVAIAAVVAMMHRAQVIYAPLIVVAAIGLWIVVYESGVHATIAGV